MYAIHLNPYTIDALQSVELPITSIDDLLGQHSTSVAVFSDYGPANRQFQTYGFYITDWGLVSDLANILRAIRDKHGAAGRYISYKRRKDDLRRRAFREWVKVVRSWPGFLYVLAVDRRIEKLGAFQVETARRKKEFAKVGLCDYKLYTRMGGAVSFLAMLSPYLKEKHKIAWVSDRDEILDTPSRQDTLSRTLGYYAETLLNKRWSDVRVIIPNEDKDPVSAIFNDCAHELLSVPDVAASSIAAALTVDGSNQPKLDCKDAEAIDMLQEIGKFQELAHYRIEEHLSCPILISLLLTEFTEDGQPYHAHRTLTLRYESQIDPLRRMDWGPDGSDISLKFLR